MALAWRDLNTGQQLNYLLDGLGSVRLMTDGPAVVDSYRYAPFGAVLAGGASNNTRRFTGEIQAPTGLIYLRARWYDPATGRFLTRDPFPGLAAAPTTQHPYVYVGNNPVNLTDPGGRIAPILIAAGVGAVIGGVAGGAGYVLAHPGGRPEDYLQSGGFWQAAGIGAASGAVAGAVGWAVPALLPAGGGLAYAVGAGVLSGAAASAAGQVTVNLLTPCTPWHAGLGSAMLWGGVTGGLAGGVGWKIGQWRVAQAAKGAVPVAQPLEQHHLLPKQFRSYFEGAGLDIDSPEFIVELPRDVHRLGPNGLHTGPNNWNTLWDRFIEANPNANSMEILEHLEWMKGVFGLR